MLFGHNRKQGYPWGGIVVLWATSDCPAFYDGYLGAIDGFCSDDVVCGNLKAPDLVIFNGFL